MALDKRQLPEVDKTVRNEKILILLSWYKRPAGCSDVKTFCGQSMYKASGYMDVDKINAAAWPALVADLDAGDQSITALAFGRVLYHISTHTHTYFPSFILSNH